MGRRSLVGANLVFAVLPAPTSGRNARRTGKTPFCDAVAIFPDGLTYVKICFKIPFEKDVSYHLLNRSLTARTTR